MVACRNKRHNYFSQGATAFNSQNLYFLWFLSLTQRTLVCDCMWGMCGLAETTKVASKGCEFEPCYNLPISCVRDEVSRWAPQKLKTILNLTLFKWSICNEKLSQSKNMVESTLWCMWICILFLIYHTKFIHLFTTWYDLSLNKEIFL